MWIIFAPFVIAALIGVGGALWATEPSRKFWKEQNRLWKQNEK